VAFENAEFFHGANVEDADGLITRGACYEIAIGRPGQGLDCVLVLMPNGSISNDNVIFMILTALKGPLRFGGPRI
jgi:hypothetical protein